MSGNPYEDGETSPEDANADLLAELRGRVEGGGAAEAPEDDADVIVAGDPVEDDPPEEGGPSRRQQRRRERGEEWKREQATKNDETAKLREDLAELRGRLATAQSQSNQHQAEDRRDPYADRRSKVREDRDNTIREYEGVSRKAHSDGRELSKDEKSGFMDRNDAHQRDMTRIDMEEYQAQSNTPELQARARLVSQYPDVMDGGKAEEYVKSLYVGKKLRGEVTAENELEQTALCVDQARKDLRLRGHDGPPPANAKQLSSYGSARGTGSGKQAAGQVRFAKDSPEREMALAFYKHVPGWTDKQKLQAFVNSNKR